MSETPTEVTAEHFRYLARRTEAEDLFLGRLREAALEAGIPPIWIAPEQASFLQILLRLARAREVVEVGTLAGYSAIWLARALPPGGRLRTIEILPSHAAFAEEWIGRSDVADRIEVVRGAAAEVLAGWPDASIDVLFLDADKESYGRYLEHGLRLLRPGGLLLADNAFAFGRLLEDDEAADVAAIRAFNDRMARTPELQAVIVPLGDGCWVGVRR